MKYRLLFVILYSISLSALADNPLLTFCLGQQPKEDDPRRGFFDTVCETTVAKAYESQGNSDNASQASAAVALQKSEAELAKTQSDLKLAEAKATADALKGLGTSIKPADAKLADLSAFTSAGQRHQADLAYITGRALGEKLIAALTAKRISEGRLFITNNSDIARQWITSEDPQAVKNDLNETKAKLDDAMSKLETCMPKEATDQPETDNNLEFFELMHPSSIVVGAQVVDLAITAVRAAADMMTPKLTAAAAVPAPASLSDAILAGIFATPYSGRFLGQSLVITSQPPVTAADNSVLALSKDTSKTAAKTADAMEVMKARAVSKKDKSKADFCIKQAGASITSAAEAIKAIGTAGADQVLGSRLDRAIRAETVEKANLVGVALVSQIAAGGAVATYQPRWPLGPRLVTAADLALAYRIQAPRSGAIIDADYLSKGCGKTLPVGNFNTKYQTADCR